MSVKLSQRQASLDVVRLVAISSVLIMHVLDNSWSLNKSILVQNSTVVIVLKFLVYNLGRIGVPLFLFLTGYLMLDRKYDWADIPHFYKKRVSKLIVVTLIWNIIYAVLRIMLGDRVFSVGTIVKELLFIGPLSAPHLWYMPTIIGIYIFLPIVANSLAHLNDRTIKILAPLMIFYSFIVPTASVFLRAAGYGKLQPGLEINFTGGICGAMAIIGYLIKRYQSQITAKLNTGRCLLLFICSMASSIILQYFTVFIHGQSNTSPWYDSIFILLAAVALFVLILQRFAMLKPSVRLTRAAESTFGIYLVHYVFIYIFVAIAKMYGFKQGLAYATTMVIVVTALSYLFCWVMQKSKRLRKLICV